MTHRIPYVDLAAQNGPLREALIAAVSRVISHGQFVLGPEVAQLEAALERFLGVPHVVGVSNGTDALVMALKLVGVGPGDEVITPSHSFVATATAVALAGARPVLVDIDERTMAISADLVEAAITPRTRAVVPVHLSGFAVDVDRLAAVCERRGLALVEDCAQAIGAKHRGRSVGSVGIGCFSMHPLKVLAALGDAGFITVADAGHAERLRHMRNIGLLDRDHCETIDGNTRLDTLQAALVLAKLPGVPGWIAARRAHADAYRATLGGVVRLPPDEGEGFSVYSAFVVRHPARDRLRAFLSDRGIDSKVHYPVPIHRQRAFAHLGVPALPVTDRVCEQILS
ncbi:MAG: DegT/DnrJ/EryC1/StrS family aminotransferase, partial [Deltaproteobacteria bacterium]